MRAFPAIAEPLSIGVEVCFRMYLVEAALLIRLVQFVMELQGMEYGSGDI